MENLDRVNDIGDLDDCANANIYETALHEGRTHAEALEHLINVTRDNARTPFQWDDSENAGFTDGSPWLMVNPKYKHINLASQINDSDSVFNFYKELISLRKNPEYESTLVYGDFSPYKSEQKNLLAYSRVEEKSVMVIANYQKDAQTLSLPSKIKKVLLSNTSKTLDNSSFNSTEIVLSPYELLVVEMV